MHLNVSENCWLNIVPLVPQRLATSQQGCSFPLPMLYVGKYPMELLFINLKRILITNFKI